MRSRTAPQAQFNPQAPPPQHPPEWTCPPHGGHAGAALSAPLEFAAKTDSFFTSRVEPQRGQAVPFQSDERTRISLSAPHAWQ